jgi:hypothetical protein
MLVSGRAIAFPFAYAANKKLLLALLRLKTIVYHSMQIVAGQYCFFGRKRIGVVFLKDDDQENLQVIVDTNYANPMQGGKGLSIPVISCYRLLSKAYIIHTFAICPYQYACLFL